MAFRNQFLVEGIVTGRKLKESRVGGADDANRMLSGEQLPSPGFGAYLDVAGIGATFNFYVTDKAVFEQIPAIGQECTVVGVVAARASVAEGKRGAYAKSGVELKVTAVKAGLSVPATAVAR
jgi:hypothetical protein